MLDHDTAESDALIASLSTIFFSILEQEGPTTMESFEDEALAKVHRLACRALECALERLDLSLRQALPAGMRIKDRRSRTLATKLGDITFLVTRAQDERGNYAQPLLDALDLPYGVRISPAARSFLVEAAAEVSYARSARLLERSGGSRVSATAVMRSMRAAGAACEAQDIEDSRELYVHGVVPSAEKKAQTLCVEADGTWFNLQGKDRDQAKRCEVKAVVAYTGKEQRDTKTRRLDCARHACVEKPAAFSRQAVAAIGNTFDLAAIETLHIGCDGEGWCKEIGRWFPHGTQVAHLDPFHINRAIASCFEDATMAWHVIEALWDGGKKEAATMIEACAQMGLARPKQARAVVAYLRNNMDLIDIEGPSLGTMESENQHLYGVRMDSFPCAWSRRGASDMARIRCRTHSGRPLPRQTRQGSAGARRQARRAKKELEWLSRQGPHTVVKSEGKGWEPPHRASVANLSEQVRFAADVDGGMVTI